MVVPKVITSLRVTREDKMGMMKDEKVIVDFEVIGGSKMEKTKGGNSTSEWLEVDDSC
jgi:hypothetical protein